MLSSGVLCIRPQITMSPPQRFPYFPVTSSPPPFFAHSQCARHLSVRPSVRPPVRHSRFARPAPVSGRLAQELCNMMIECCSQERTWLPYYGLIAQRFCMMHRRWQGAFTECFETNYNTIHRCVGPPLLFALARLLSPLTPRIHAREGGGNLSVARLAFLGLRCPCVHATEHN